MRVLLAFLALSTSLAVSAMEDLNIKGLKIGSTLDDARALVHGQFHCHPMQTGDPDVRICGDIDDTYAGERVHVLRKFREGKLVQIYISDMSPENFAEMESALVEKFGKPATVQHEELHNAMGAKYDNVKDLWRQDGAAMLFKRYCDSPSKSCLELSSEKYLLEEAALEASKKKSDM
jgi:hypothetical protein